MGTQIEIARTIIAGGGDYLLALKANWPALLADIETFFADPANRADCRIFDTVDADPGRLRSEEQTSELQSLMRISYAVFCLKQKNASKIETHAIPEPPLTRTQ